MNAETLLARLEGVRETGSGRWLARCPAHDDKSPSLSIRELDDGTILIHDFGLCDTVDILSTVGLELKDLFPEPLPGSRGESLPPKRKPFPAVDALKALAYEACIVSIAASDIADGQEVSADDAERVATAAGRIGAAVEMAS